MSRARTIRTGKLGRKELRLVEQNECYFGLADGKVCGEGGDADDVWRRLQDEAGRSDPRYFGFDDARKRFLRLFPGGFHSEAYAAKERDHKLAAQKRLEESAPLEEAAVGSGYGEAVLSVFRATGMFSRFELAPLQDALHGPGADDFVRAAARFTLQPAQAELLTMREALGDAAKWTVVTYLPFLWRPDCHMFLKPEH